MKQLFFFVAILLAACNGNDKHEHASTDTTKTSTTSTVTEHKPEVVMPDSLPPSPPDPVVHANARFKEVTVVQKTGQQFLISGKAQVFEANISWVVEDGHEELKKGFVTTDAGAPAWGNFSFTIDVEKKRQNSTLTLILFESSAKDGSRQHELPIRLY